MKNRKLLIGLAALAILAVVPAVSCGGPMINDVTTGQTPAYPDLQPQRFDADQDKVFDAAVDAITSLGIEITKKDRAAGTIQGVATTRILRFKDDVTIILTRDGESNIVNIRSASRVGKSDFGMNAKRIRKIQHALAERL